MDPEESIEEEAENIDGIEAAFAAGCKSFDCPELSQNLDKLCAHGEAGVPNRTAAGCHGTAPAFSTRYTAFKGGCVQDGVGLTWCSDTSKWSTAFHLREIYVKEQMVQTHRDNTPP